MARSVLRWSGIALAGLAGLLLLVVVMAAVTDRPSAEPFVVDRDAPEVTAFLEAEAAWLAHHDLDHTEHLVEVAGHDLAVRVLEVGAGPAVVVLPGGAGEAAYLTPLLAELDGYRLLLVNLPGGGASDGVDLRGIDERRLARDTLDSVYGSFELDVAPIVASSRGGAWAWWYGLDRPEGVSASVQLGAPALVEGTTVPAALAVLGVPGLNRVLVSVTPPASPEQAVAGFHRLFGHPVETVESLSGPARGFAHAAQQLPTFGLSWRSSMQVSTRFAGLGGWNPDLEIGAADLTGLDHRALLVWPSDDPFGDVDAGRRIAALLPDADLHVAGIGHLPWLDDPAGVAELVADFLRDDGHPRTDGEDRP
jgi:2-hydroxy-6-oxonona-2,4-dienedioate hydrolase